MSQGDNARPLFITADAATPHQAVVRAMDAGQLAASIQAQGIEAIGIKNPPKALQKAKELSGEDSLLVVFGSVFLVERIRQLAMIEAESI